MTIAGAKNTGGNLARLSLRPVQRRLQEKAINGVFYRQIETLGLEHCSRWLFDGVFSPGDEAKFLVAQDGTLKTRKYRAEVLKEQVSPL